MVPSYGALNRFVFNPDLLSNVTKLMTDSNENITTRTNS